jgi:hypothetical protein
MDIYGHSINTADAGFFAKLENTASIIMTIATCASSVSTVVLMCHADDAD